MNIYLYCLQSKYLQIGWSQKETQQKSWIQFCLFTYESEKIKQMCLKSTELFQIYHVGKKY